MAAVLLIFSGCVISLEVDLSLLSVESLVWASSNSDIYAVLSKFLYSPSNEIINLTSLFFGCFNLILSLFTINIQFAF